MPISERFRPPPVGQCSSIGYRIPWALPAASVFPCGSFMSGDRPCVGCGAPLEGADERRVWCSDACRTWVHDRGGPAAAAELLEAWASTWDRLASLGDRAKAKASAAALRARARRLREHAGAAH